MAIFTMVTLRDGSELSQATLSSAMINIKIIYKENSHALLELVEKRNNLEYNFTQTEPSNSKKILKKHNLINDQENVPDAIRKVVLNHIHVCKSSIELVDPWMQSKTVSKLELKSQEEP
jgi:hypothetical protein